MPVVLHNNYTITSDLEAIITQNDGKPLYGEIEMFRRIYGNEATAIWCEMTALKYRMRMGLKPGEPIERDMEKEDFYLNKAKELRAEGLDDYERMIER